MMTWPQKKEVNECETHDERVRNPSIYSSWNLVQRLSSGLSGEMICRRDFQGV